MWNCETFQDQDPRDTFQKHWDCSGLHIAAFQEKRIKQISVLAFFSKFDTISLLNMIFHYFSEG